MYRTPSLLLASLLALSAFAQTDVHGDLQLSTGAGQASPVVGSARLDIRNQRFQLSPRIAYSRITADSTAFTTDNDYRLTPSGHVLANHIASEDQGHRFTAGVSGRYLVSPATKITLAIDFDRLSTENLGTQTFDLQAESRSVLHADMLGTNRRQTFAANAALRHTLRANGDQLSFSYAHQNEGRYTESTLTATGGNYNPEEVSSSYYLEVEARTLMHTLQADYRHLLPGTNHSLLFGARYDQRDVSVQDNQTDFGMGSYAEFDHQLRLLAAFAEYHLTLPQQLDLTARLEYQHSQLDYSRSDRLHNADLSTRYESNTRYVNDLVPMLRARYTLSPSHDLTLLYAMRILRPDAMLLFPDTRFEPYAQTYGNPELVATHANNLQLTHGYHRQGLRLNTTLQHIFADDGFNAIWIVRDDHRFYTWGNEGIRRAWGLTPDLEWQLAPATTLNARATVLWDKRIAEAIHMAKEHWGITAHLALSQQLPQGFRLMAFGDYSEGNTIDLYSHAGQAISYGGELQHNAFCQGRLHLALAYQHLGYARTIITQGMYTGSQLTMPDNRFRLEARARWKF